MGTTYGPSKKYHPATYTYDGKFTADPIVDNVINSYIERSHMGMTKYGVTMEENRASFLQWLVHLQEELMDATLYIERLKKEI